MRLNRSVNSGGQFTLTVERRLVKEPQQKHDRLHPAALWLSSIHQRPTHTHTGWACCQHVSDCLVCLATAAGTTRLGVIHHCAMKGNM